MIPAHGSQAQEPWPVALEMARAVREAGGRALLVGGWVRDRWLGHQSKDIDLEVYGLPADTLETLLARFGPVKAVGDSFPVFKVRDIDVALPRRESKRGRGHRAFAVTGDPHMTLEEAARRRDFTINAIFWDPLENEYVDPFKGRDDLQTRTLRVVDAATFGDDSLRVLRAVQFAARFDLTLDAGTAALCRDIPLDDLPAERVWGELEKLLLLADRPSIGLALALDLGVVARLFPELLPLVGCPQEPEWHPEGDVWVHTLLVVDQARRRLEGLSHAAQVVMMMAAVCHDLGKPSTTALIDGRIRSYNHEEAGVAPTLALLDRLNLHSIDGYDVRGQITGLVAHHLKPGMWHKAPQVGDGAFRRLAQKLDLELLALLAKSDCEGRPGDFDCSAMDWFLERARALGVAHDPPRPLLMGRHLAPLGIAPGPRMGEILRQVYERQLDGGIASLDEAVACARGLIEGGSPTPR